MKTTRIKILGCGTIIRRLLPVFASDYSDFSFEIFCRRSTEFSNLEGRFEFRPFDEYKSFPGNISILACSVNEASVLQRTGGSLGRIEVAKENLNLISKIASQNVFCGGTLFVLTNPSEIVGELILKKSPLTQVFALGLTSDFDRYSKIFTSIGVAQKISSDFHLAGNHWDFPLPIFLSDSKLKNEVLDNLSPPIANSLDPHQELLERLKEKLQSVILAEFSGFKPPVQSGMNSILELLQALRSQNKIFVSGFNGQCFQAGTLDLEKNLFVPTKTTDPASETVLNKIFERHCKTRDQLLENL